MTEELNSRLKQLFHDVDDILSDVTTLVKDAAIDVLNFKSEAALDVQAFTDAKLRLNKLEMLYIKLKLTKEEYEEYYKSPFKASR